MKLRRLFVYALMALALMGCTEISQIFEFNLFAGLDPVAVPDVASLPADKTEALDVLDEEFASDSFFQAMSEEQQGDMAIYLEDIWLDGNGTTEEQQRAGLMYADLNMKTTGGDQFVNNVTLVVEDLVAGDMFKEGQTAEEVQTGIQDLFNGLIPEDVQENPDPEVKKQQVIAMLDGLVAAMMPMKLSATAS